MCSSLLLRQVLVPRYRRYHGTYGIPYKTRTYGTYGTVGTYGTYGTSLVTIARQPIPDPELAKEKLRMRMRPA